MHIYTLCPSRNSVERFQRSCTYKLFWVVTFILAKFLSSKMGNSEKNYWIKISCGYAHLHIMSFITKKLHEILLSGFRGVAMTRKTGLTDWLTDGRVKKLYPGCGKRTGPFIWTNLKSLHPRIYYAKFKWKRHICSWEEDENVKSLRQRRRQ